MQRMDDPEVVGKGEDPSQKKAFWKHFWYQKAFFIVYNVVSEVRAIYPTAFQTTNFVNQTKFKRTLRIGRWFQLRHVDVITESKTQVVEIKPCRGNDGIGKVTLLQFVGNPSPQTQLESLVTVFGLIQHKAQARTGIDLERWSLAHHDEAR